MNILMVLDHSFPTDLRVENEATTLINSGHHVGILSVANYDKSENVEYKGITIYRKAVSLFTQKKMHALAGMIPWMDIFIANCVSKILSEKKYDVIHFHDLYTFGAAKLLKKRHALKYVGDMHENYVEVINDYKWATKFPNRLLISHKKWRRKEIEWLSEMDKVITVSPGIVNRIISKGVKNEDVVLVPNAIKTKVFDDYEVDEDIVERYKKGFTLVYVGGFIVNRGLEHVIEAMAKLRERIPSIKLLLIGDGDYRSILEQMVHKLNLKDIVHFEGWQDQSKVKSYLLASDIGLIPFKRTPQTDNSSSNKLFQYMYLKLPILATNCISVKKLVDKEKCGLVYESDNVEQFIAATEALYQDSEMRAGLAENGYQSILNKYNWDVTVKDMVFMYDTLDRSCHN